jgi:hypothetical protein
MFGRKLKLPKILSIFKEMGVVTTKDDVQVNSKNRGLTSMLVGYSVVQANEVYRVLNLNSKMMIQTRDTVWIGKRYNDRLKRKIHQMIIISMKT